MRSMLFALVLSSLTFLAQIVQAAQNQHIHSPLTCDEVGGMIDIMSRLTQATQVGSLGNPSSQDIWKKDGRTQYATCWYNDSYTIIHERVIWLDTPKFLVMLQVVDIGNSILRWRPADILEKEHWRIPRGCNFIKQNTSRLTVPRYLAQNIAIKPRCKIALPNTR